jgi:gas vesicle protein
MFFQKFYDYQKEKEARTNKKVAFFSFITGAIGLAAGYLSSKENRETAKKVAHEAANNAKDIGSDASIKIKEYSKTASQKFEDVKKAASSKLDEIEDRIDQAMNQNKDEEIELVPVTEEIVKETKDKK